MSEKRFFHVGEGRGIEEGNMGCGRSNSCREERHALGFDQASALSFNNLLAIKRLQQPQLSRGGPIMAKRSGMAKVQVWTRLLKAFPSFGVSTGAEG